jgi:hypothetical protein
MGDRRLGMSEHGFLHHHISRGKSAAPWTKEICSSSRKAVVEHDHPCICRDVDVHRLVHVVCVFGTEQC